MKITILYVGSSLLAPLKNAEREINRAHNLDLRVAAYNFGSPLSDCEWLEVEGDLSTANVNVDYSGFGLNDGTVSVSITDYQFQFVIPIVGTTITMPSYKTTLTAESAGLIPADV